MFKKIMVALDGSAEALTALAPAGCLVQAFGAEVHLVAVNRRVACPLMIVPEPYQERGPFHKILVPLDGSVEAKQAIRPGRRFVRHFFYREVTISLLR